MRRKTIIFKYLGNYEDVLNYLNSDELKEMLSDYVNITIKISQLLWMYTITILGNRK